MPAKPPPERWGGGVAPDLGLAVLAFAVFAFGGAADLNSTRSLPMHAEHQAATADRRAASAEADERRHRLTPAQEDHLRLLLRAGALDEEQARSPFDPGMKGLVPGVVAALAERGLARSKVRRARRSQVTVYWLTPAGENRATRLVLDR